MPRRSNKQAAEPTYTTLVLDYLIKGDDFFSIGNIADALKLTRHQVRVTLIHLQRYKVVDSVGSGGTLYWFATPELDTRVRVTEARVREEPGTRSPRGTGRSRRKAQ